MSEQPMSPDERVLLEHRWAVRVNLPGDAAHAARTARWVSQQAAYAGVARPVEVVQAIEVLEKFALVVGHQVEVDRAELERRGIDPASFQRELEQAARLREEDDRE